MEGIVDEKLEGLEETIGEKNDSLKIFLEPLKWMFDSYMPTMDSLANAGVKIGNIQDNEALRRNNVIAAANEIRNILKHGLLDERKVIEFDAPEIAKDMLDRAISNYFQLTSNLTSEMQQFQDMHVQDNAFTRPCSEEHEESSALQ